MSGDGAPVSAPSTKSELADEIAALVDHLEELDATRDLEILRDVAAQLAKHARREGAE